MRYYTTPSNDDGSRKANVSLNRVLPDDKKQFFGRKALVCVEYKDLSQQQEIELFQRVQLGKPLTKAETFRASQGVWQDLAKTFETDYAEVIGRKRQHQLVMKKELTCHSMQTQQSCFGLLADTSMLLSNIRMYGS